MSSRFPWLSDPSTSFLEICSDSQVLLLSSNLRLNSTSCLSPFLHHFCFLLISSFVSQFFIFSIKHEFLKLLFEDFSRWIIGKIAWATFDSILFMELGRLIGCIEDTEWIVSLLPLLLFKSEESVHRNSPCIGSSSQTFILAHGSILVSCSCLSLRMSKYRSVISHCRSCWSLFAFPSLLLLSFIVQVCSRLHSFNSLLAKTGLVGRQSWWLLFNRPHFIIFYSISSWFDIFVLGTLLLFEHLTHILIVLEVIHVMHEFFLPDTSVFLFFLFDHGWIHSVSLLC